MGAACARPLRVCPRTGIAVLASVLTACDSPSEPRRVPPNPEIRWIVPPAVIAGETVWIVGRNFGADAQATSVLFDGSPAEIVSVTDSLVVAFVRADESARQVAVELSVDGTSVRAVGSFEIVLPPAPPGILTVEPDSVLGGDTLTIRGRHFLPLLEGSTPAVTIGNRVAGPLLLSDTLLLAGAPVALAGSFPVVYTRDALTRATSFQRLAVIPRVAGSYDVLAASAAPDSCEQGAELVGGIQAQPFQVEQDRAALEIVFLGDVYRDVLDVNAFEAARAEAGTARVDSLLLAFVFPTGPAATTGAFVIRYGPADRCNLRVALFARRREEPPG